MNLTPPTNRQGLPTTRGFPDHWGNGGEREHRREALRALAFLQGAELMGSDGQRRDLEGAHKDLRGARADADDARVELATTRGALDQTQDALRRSNGDLEDCRRRERRRRELAERMQAMTEKLLDDPATAAETTVPLPRINGDDRAVAS